jgi:hypothetical protein
MAKRKRTTTEKTIDQHIREGRGQGHGDAYKPWLLVQDVASHGLVHRVKGWKTGRVHHLLSNSERDYFYMLEWSVWVVDIREQYPLLPLEETLALAERCGVRHPIDPVTKQAVVLTTDFLVDVQGGSRYIQQARTVKPAKDLESRRVLEKLELERLYWQARKVDWGIVTEYEIPKVYAKSVRTLHKYKQIEDRLSPEVNVSDIKCALFTYCRQQPLPLRQLAKSCDTALGLLPGTSLTVVYHLLATRQWHVDLNTPLHMTMPLVNQTEEVA